MTAVVSMVMKVLRCARGNFKSFNTLFYVSGPCPVLHDADSIAPGGQHRHSA